MVWLDFLLIGVIFGVSFLGYKRGFIIALTEISVVIFSLAISMRLYRPLSGFFQRTFLGGWSELWTERLGFWLVFVPIALGIFTAGFHTDRIMREQERVSKEVHQWLGVMVGVVEALMLSCLFTAWLNQSEVMISRERPKFRRAPVVQLVRGLNGIFQPVVYIVAPADLAKDFIAKGMKKNF